MTALCASNGPSQIKPNVAANLDATAAFVATTLTAAGLPALAVIAGYVGAYVIDLATVCTEDPPALPTLTVQDYLNITVPALIPSRDASVQKFKDLVTRLLWPSLCQCVSGAQPGPLPLPTIPVDWPTAPSGGSLGCWVKGWNGVAQGPQESAGGGPKLSDLSTQLLPGTAGATYVPASGVTATRMILPSGFSPTDGTIVLDLPAQTAPCGSGSHTHDVEVGVDCLNSSGTIIGGGYPTVGQTACGTTPPYTTHVSSNFTVPSGTVALGCWAAYPWSNAPVTDAVNINITLNCPGGGSGVPCSQCPPDQTTAAMLESIRATVQQLQRYLVPFAYVVGATHSSLSGAGELTIPNALKGLLVTVTTNPSYTGVVVGDPNAVFDVGYISVGDSTGWAYTQPIRRSPWTWLPPDMPTWTKVGYSLNPGVVVSIGEVEAEA